MTDRMGLLYLLLVLLLYNFALFGTLVAAGLTGIYEGAIHKSASIAQPVELSRLVFSVFDGNISYRFIDRIIVSVNQCFVCVFLRKLKVFDKNLHKFDVGNSLFRLFFKMLMLIGRHAVGQDLEDAWTLSIIIKVIDG
jgi:hypothetical protein